MQLFYYVFSETIDGVYLTKSTITWNVQVSRIKRIIFQKELNQKIPDVLLGTVYREASKKLTAGTDV